MHTVDVEHRRHAEVELGDPRPEGPGARELPPRELCRQCRLDGGRCLAHNMARWVGQLGLEDETWRAARTIGRWLIALPGRLTRTARRFTFHLPARLPWQTAFMEG